MMNQKVVREDCKIQYNALSLINVSLVTIFIEGQILQWNAHIMKMWTSDTITL